MLKKYDTELLRIGKKAKRLRMARKLSQQNVSDACDVDIRTIQRFEAGKQNISLDLFFAISDALEISPVELLR